MLFRSLSLVFILVLNFGCAQNYPDSTALDTQNQTTVNSLEDVQDFDQLAQLINSDVSQKLNSQFEIENTDEDETPEELSLKNKKILVAGDSWAVFACVFGSMRKALNFADSKLVNDRRCLSTSKLGIEAREWLGSNQDDRVKKFLKRNAKIEYLFLSLGGNDLMGQWNKNYSPLQEEKLFIETSNVIKKAIQNYQAINPRLKVIVSGYDFPNFREKHLISLYNKIYNRMERPTVQQINEGLIRFTRHMSQLNNKKNVFYIHHLGMSHFYDGSETAGLAPFKTLNPRLISTQTNLNSVGGDYRIASSKYSMINWLNLDYDAFHLSNRNYYNLMLHAYYNVIKNIE